MRRLFLKLLWLVSIFVFFFQKELSAQNSESEKVITLIEQDPEFPGGQQGLLRYFGQNLKYPESALKDSVQGKVIVRFLVKGTGVIDSVSITHSVRRDLDKEAVRLIQAMPMWKPGKQSSKAIDVWFELPITFKL